MRHGQKIAVVIPALDEERAIARVIGDIPKWVDEIVVADNGSSDRTRAVAEAAGARVVDEAQKGYGAACQAGLRALDRPDIIVFLDGDYSDHPEEMASLVDPIARSDADLVVGSRVRGRLEHKALTPQQKAGNFVACRLLRLIWGVEYSDLGPFRAIRATDLARLGMTDRNYGWTIEMQIKAAEHGLRHLEVPVSYRPRIGVSKISGRLSAALKAAWVIATVVVRSAFSGRQLPVAARQ